MDGDGDSGWIKGLPGGWIDGFICARRLYAKLEAEHPNTDPAPWHSVVNADYWGPYFGKSPEEHTRSAKLDARIVAAFQSGVFSKNLAPAWFDGLAFKNVPAHAFGNSRVVHAALLNGGFDIDPLWPDEWQQWSGQGWAVPKAQFEAWMQGGEAVSIVGLPIAADAIPPCDVAPMDSRLPSAGTRIPLSEAITWIAFGIALDADRLGRAVNWDSLANGDLQGAQAQMEAALARLVKAGADGLVPMFGRHLETHGEKGKRTEKIETLTLEDYRKASIIGHDSLYYGEGLFVWYRARNDSQGRGSERSDHFANVTVEREALLKHCGERLDLVAALLTPFPAVLPEIGAVMGLEEAVCLLAYGRPSDDIKVFMDYTGNVTLLDHSGEPLGKIIDGEKPSHLIAFIEANLSLWSAFQDGTLRGLVAPTDGPVLSVPRLYWNAINPECLAYVYEGMPGSPAGRGCPLLLSRQVFDEWRAKPNPADDLAIYAGGVQYEWIENSDNLQVQKRQKPGPKADPDWPDVVLEVTQDCLAAGYRKPLKRGQLAAIGTLLLEKMSAKDKHFSDDAAAKYAKNVIAALPDNSNA